MIKSNISHHPLQIIGQNKMDFAWAVWYVFMIALLILFAMWDRSLYWQNYVFFISVLVSVLLILKIGFRFSIILTERLLTINKSFLGLKYLTLEINFDDVF